MEIGLLFLADHSLTPGIQQLDLWRQWCNSDPRFTGRIRIMIHMQHKDKAILKSWAKFIVDDPVATHWGTDSLVKAHLQLLRACVKKYDKVTHFFLLSGSCIPIQRVSYFFQAKHTMFNIITDVSGKQNWHDILTKAGASKSDAKKSLQTEQWCVLKREHVDVLLSEKWGGPLWTKIKSVYHALPDFVPDEYFIYWFLRLKGVKPSALHDVYLMLSFRHKYDDPSPIVFESLTHKYDVFWGTKKYPTKNISLQDGLKQRETAFFFRKVNVNLNATLNDLIPAASRAEKQEINNYDDLTEIL